MPSKYALIIGGRAWYQPCSFIREARERAHWHLNTEERDERMKPPRIDDVSDIRLQWQEIARTEVTRQRRRLALLSDEQRVAVESALVSVADHMFEVVVQGADNCPDVDRFKYFNVWRRESVAA